MRDLDRAKEIVPFGPHMRLGERLRTARENAGLSIRQAGHLVDFAPFSIQALEEDGDKPSLGQITKLARLYGVTALWLSTGEPDIGQTALVELAVEFKQKGVPPEDARKLLLVIEMLAKRSDGEAVK
jgi:transcriptional regulator with XRE-family HTH domain